MPSTQVNIQGLINTLASGTKKVGPLTLANTTAIGGINDIAMSATVATVNVPVGAIGAIIVPPIANAASIKFITSSNGADSGLPISPSLPSLVAFAATPTTMTFTFGATSSSPSQTLEVNFF